jgi:hypothetical protein
MSSTAYTLKYIKSTEAASLKLEYAESQGSQFKLAATSNNQKKLG